MEDAGSLNESHKLHLINNVQYADQLLAEIEGILTAAASKSPFPKYRIDIAPTQRRVVEDYLARIRAQMLRVLEAEGIERPGPQFGAIHSIRVTLAFVRIALTEIGPRYMRGYGEVPESAIAQLNGLVTELQGLVDKLDAYLAQGLGQDLEGRLERLERTGEAAPLLRKLERVVSDHGLVEFRPQLSMILDRLESTRFEIAVFGRVSSGKSSLLNHILQARVLPVGVNPITAVPTRLVAGPAARLVVSFADRRVENHEIDRLADFVTEQRNPANTKGVTRITVELPSSRLREGVVFVDTPGLGSLATAGAAETRAYLPQCDLGVLLIDAGSTLTEEDLSTIQALYEAAVPVSILLSKADLLTAEDRDSALEYIAAQIRSRLGLNLMAHPVSIVREHAALLDTWFEEHIAPLCGRHRQLASESVGRKVGALREAVEAALRSKLERAPAGGGRTDHLKKVEVALRRAAGRLPDAMSLCLKASDEVREVAGDAIGEAASQLVEHWARHGAEPAPAVVGAALVNAASGKAKMIHGTLENLAGELSEALRHAAEALDVTELPAEGELSAPLREMPRLDLGTLEVFLRPSFLMRLGKRLAKARVQSRLRNDIGHSVSEAFRSYGRLLEAWVRRAGAELQSRFDAHADGYRAQLQRLIGAAEISPEAREAILRDLDDLRGETVASAQSRSE